MMISKETARLSGLVERGALAEESLKAAGRDSVARGRELEEIVLDEYGVPRRDLLEVLSAYYGVPYIEYDERLPVTPELLHPLKSDVLFTNLWFPIIKDNEKIIIAANDPDSPALKEEIQAAFPDTEFEFRVALIDDLRWYIQDFLHAQPKNLIGIERTGLAFWRNTMAHWRTRLACYRTDLAKGRTGLSILRWGLGIIALSGALLRMRKELLFVEHIYWGMMVTGFMFVIFGFTKYVESRRSRMSPPRHHTLIEVTAAVTSFLENYQLPEAGKRHTKGTMLARLGDSLLSFCSILNPVPASKERTHLARERNVLAAHRTLEACYRTIYARARTGLAFIRTGVAFFSLGFGFLRYFSFGIGTAVDIFLMAAGLFMIIDGTIWYMPVRKEKGNLQRIAT